ncbi:MAG: hypothetical protein OEV73_00350 [Desulfobulbaceae bacterium]|nr:hypothetical protein [Desulfobulbaceae bacterium]
MPESKPDKCIKTPYQSTHLGALCHVCNRKCNHANHPRHQGLQLMLARDHRARLDNVRPMERS